ncbi:MAG: hypothetical protein KDK76_05770, partial [Chlamydiia bacterium]|nr:hypothetical protein [Chlamydiia bacterium]
FFGAQVDIETLTFCGGALNRATLTTTLSALDLVHHLDFLNSAGLLPVRSETLDEMRGPHVSGEMKVAFVFNRQSDHFSFQAESSHLKMGPIDLDRLFVHGEKEKERFTLDHFEAGPLKLHAKMVKKEEGWEIPNLEILWKKSFLKSGVALFNETGKTLEIPLESLRIDLEEVGALFPQSDVDLSYLTGVLSAQGQVIFDYSKGFRNGALDSKFQLIGEDFGKGHLRIDSPQKLHLTYSPRSGFNVGQGEFNFLHPRSNQLWGKCLFNKLNYQNGVFKGEGVKVTIPPEMVHFLGQTHSIPYLGYEEERVIAFNYPIKWENQIEAFFNFELGENPFASGSLKEGYYWIGDKAWYLNSCTFSYEKDELSTSLNTIYDEIPFDLNAHLSFSPHFSSRLVIQETCHDQRGEDPLVIQMSWNENEGFFVQSLDGEICGLDFAFHHNPRGSFLDRTALVGQLKINVPKLSQILPKEMQERVKEFEIGKGYELSGDLILSKKAFEESHFSGYLKGKNFHLLGSQMGTLMSEIDIRSDHIELDHFNLSDASGIFTIESIRLLKQTDGTWDLSIPEIAITDFRPSLLNKIGKYPSRIKPLTIRELYASNIRGTLGNPSSFVGKGSLNFINTFKRDYHLLDIPFEILGRLGLDMGLLVPVRGELEYVIVDGRIYFTELKQSYSEGKRSQFFLSPTEHSYVDFDGNINVSIKMKQYVLLKVTEPFTLSIGGTFENPKYGLR